MVTSGKGGVGKTTLAAATALLLMKRGRRVRLIHWNPLGDEVLERSFPEIPRMTLESLQCFKEYALKIVRFERLYHTVFDNPVLKTFLKAAPGLSETVMAGKIYDLVDKNEQDTLIVDLPSSGHAVTFFRSPLGIQKVFRFGFVYQDSRRIVDLFLSPQSRVDLVTLAEDLPLREVAELRTKLEKELPLPFGFFHLNQCCPVDNLSVAGPLSALASELRERKAEEKKAEEILKGEIPLLRHKESTAPRTREIVLEIAHRLESL